MNKQLSTLFMLCMIIGCPLIFSKKLNLPENIFESGKPNDCERCKLLTNSFNHWLDKTSRGKFEGGDAAWEESKLKSYARSEIRLVEVQEGLCSEVKKYQDQCYSLAENAEQALEKWWFNEDPQSDLYSWLCIEILQLCCPQKHFGETCTTCPMDKNNVVCSGNGQCAGEGTRTGNGSCVCKKGYSGILCDGCTNDYYSTGTGCRPCHKSCKGCSGHGAASCIECRVGWKIDYGTCIDIDECLNQSVCNSEEYCVNKEGSYSCKPCHSSCKTCQNEGPSNCTSCESNSVLWAGVCVGNEEFDLLIWTLRRLALYTGMIIISIFVFRKSKLLASLVVLVIAIYVYFNEKSSEINLIDLFTHLYTNNIVRIKK